MRYDFDLIEQFCRELGFSTERLTKTVEIGELRVDLGNRTVLCFVNAELDNDCLIDLETAWHYHDDMEFYDGRTNSGIEMNYLDLLSGLADGQVLIAEQWRSDDLIERYLIHRDYNDGLYLEEGQQLIVRRAVKSSPTASDSAVILKNVRHRMGQKLPPRQLEFYQAIDEILWRDWDPIGLFGMDAARDEYRMYLPEVYRLALKGDRGKIAEYLFWAATERMGLTTQRNQHLAVAEKILAAKEKAGLPDGDS